MSDKARWMPANDCVVREVDGETVILDLRAGTYFGLNAVGTRVWQLLGEHRTRAQIVDTLVGEYEVSRAQLDRDVAALLTDLHDHGLVRVHDPDREGRS